MNTIDMTDAREWALTCEAGDYLCEYEDVYEPGDDSDDGSRCGFDDQELDELGRILRGRDMRLEADDVGLVAIEIAAR